MCKNRLWRLRLAACLLLFLSACVHGADSVASKNIRERASAAAEKARTWITKPISRRLVATAGAALTVEELTYDQVRPLRMWIISIDNSQASVAFDVTEPNPQEGVDGRRFETLCETTLAFAQRKNVDLAINTSAFGPGRGSSGQPMDVAGLAAYHGEVYSQAVKNYGAMFIDREGQIRLKAPPLEESGVWNVVAGFRMLLDDGECVVNDDVYLTSFGNINPRTAVGVDRSGQKLWIIVADGRQKERTLGLTIPELATAFQWLGAWDALNLDGGGSSTLVMRGDDGSHRIVNEPINGRKVGVLRQVAHNLGVRLKQPIIWQKPQGATTVDPSIPLFELTDEAKRLRLPFDVQLDSELQTILTRLDERIGSESDIPADKRAMGLVDLRTSKVAMINGDAMFYGASVPKIAIVLEYLRQHPELVALPDSLTMKELQRVIKRSDNALAAKYGRLADIGKIQEMLQSETFQLYDADHGGGIWCGKYYGSPQPRTGDPLKDLSHAATVRQCLRYYLMLEQGRLASPEVCTRLRDVFAAPWLELHDDNFAAGLRGTGVTLIRKNGLWEDWHLDSARVALGDGAILLAGIVHHPNGPDYLSRMAREIVTALSPSANKSLARISERPWLGYRHATFFLTGSKPKEWKPHSIKEGFDPSSCFEMGGVALDESGRATTTFPILHANFKFNEALASWNVDVPTDVSYAVELSVGTRFDERWSPWLMVDQQGSEAIEKEPRKVFDGGKINIDYFVSKNRFDRIRLRMRWRGPQGKVVMSRKSRVSLTISDTTGRVDSWSPTLSSPPAPLAKSFTRRLKVPFRSQYTGREDLLGRICSPASLSMVLAYHGINKPTVEVVNACHDEAHSIYGNWPRNIAAAYRLGAPGYLTRINHWGIVQRLIASDRPVIASIRFDKPGQIEAAPYQMTNGHLIVICGFDKDGNVYVNDSATAKAEDGQLVYDRDQLEAVWFGGSGGVAYVLESPAK